MILGIAGPMHVGKTDLANKLSEREGFRLESFAKPLKELIKYMGLPEERESFQLLGQGARDIVYPDIWIDSLKLRINPTFDYVIDDVRYPNELAMCDITIRLECDLWTQWERYQRSSKFDPKITHDEWLAYTSYKSETALDPASTIYSLELDTKDKDSEQVFASVRDKIEIITNY